MTVEVGATYRLKNHVGYIQDLDPDRETEVEGLGKIRIEEVLNRHHPLFQGQIGTVVAIVPEGVAGGGKLDAENIVFSFEARALVNHEPGKPAEQVQHVPDTDNHPLRFWSCEEEDLDKYFDFVAGPPPVEEAEPVEEEV